MLKVLDQLGSVSKLLVAAAAVIAMIPGTAQFMGVIELPVGLSSFVDIASLVIGISIIIFIILAKGNIGEISASKSLKISAFSVLAGLILTFIQFRFAEEYVHSAIIDEKEMVIVTPLVPSEDIGRVMRPWQWDYAEALEHSKVRADLIQDIGDENLSTTVIMVLLIFASQGLISFGIFFSAWKIAQD